MRWRWRTIIDIEVARYNPLLSAWQLERAQAGGALPGVPSSASQADSVASGQGVAGSQAAAGVTAAGGNASGNGAGNATDLSGWPRYANPGSVHSGVNHIRS